MALTTLPTAALATGSVGTSQLADGAVTTEKLVADVNFRNLIINGDMTVSQRGTTQTGVTSTAYGEWCDRWNFDASSAGTWTLSQSSTVPTGQGFGYSLKYDCTTADASLGASDYVALRALLEAQNLQQLKYGTSNAESLTLSFWVRSNKTGTYIVWFYADDGNRTISKAYTINSADTWEKKTITIDGDTAGTINNDNGIGFRVNFFLGAGSNYTSGTLASSWQTDSNSIRAAGQVNLADSTSNEWYITGVQLEVGTSASDFEFLPYDVNLQRCKRYFQRIWMNRSDNNFWGPQRYFDANNVILGETWFSPEMRTQPSFSYTGTPIIKNNGGGVTGWTGITGGQLSNTRAEVQFIKTGHGLTNSNTLAANLSDSSTFFKYDAEL